MQGLAQAVLLLHFMIAAFIAAGLVLIPLGGFVGLALGSPTAAAAGTRCVDVVCGL